MLSGRYLFVCASSFGTSWACFAVWCSGHICPKMLQLKVIFSGSKLKSPATCVCDKKRVGLEVAFLRPKNSLFGIWWRRILHEENRRRNWRIEQLKWMGFSMKLWLKLKIFLTFKWRFSSFIQIEVSRSYKISYIIGATGSDRKQKPVQYFHFF